MKRLIILLLCILAIYCCFNYQNIGFLNEIIDIYHYQLNIINQDKNLIKETDIFLNNGPIINQNNNKHEGIYKQYYYEHLNSDKQKLYNEIYQGICSFDDKISVSSNDINEIEEIFMMIVNDNPHLFYFDPSKQQSMLTSFLNNNELRLSYIMNEEEVQEMNAKLREVTTSIIDKASILNSDIEKVQYVYDFIIDHCDYVIDADNNQNILSVFINQESVCAGYARSMKYLLDFLDIESCVLVGKSKDDTHATLMARIDGNYYYFDPTWGDPIIEKKDQKSYNANMRYTYFAMSDEDLNLYFKADYPEIMQNSNSNKENYFIANDLYIDSYDTFIALLKDKANNKNMIFKCSNEQLFNEIIDSLTNDQEVAKILKSSYTLQYDPYLYSISITKK